MPRQSLLRSSLENLEVPANRAVSDYLKPGFVSAKGKVWVSINGQTA